MTQVRQIKTDLISLSASAVAFLIRLLIGPIFGEEISHGFSRITRI